MKERRPWLGPVFEPEPEIQEKEWREEWEALPVPLDRNDRTVGLDEGSLQGSAWLSVQECKASSAARTVCKTKCD